MLAGNGRSKLLDLNNMRTNFVNTVYARVYTNEERLHARNRTCICIDTDECTRAREYLLAILQEPILPRNLYFSLSLMCVCVCVCPSGQFRAEKLTFAARQPRKRGIFHPGRSLASLAFSTTSLPRRISQRQISGAD